MQYPVTRSLPSALRVFVALVPISVGLNYVWELAQSPLYTGIPADVSLGWHCFIASLGDGVIIAIIHVLGWFYFGRPYWFAAPGKPQYALMLGAGLLLALGVELFAVHILDRWGYAPVMPLVPGLRVGLVPLAQMLVLPPVAFWLTARSVQRRT